MAITLGHRIQPALPSAAEPVRPCGTARQDPGRCWVTQGSLGGQRTGQVALLAGWLSWLGRRYLTAAGAAHRPAGRVCGQVAARPPPRRRRPARPSYRRPSAAATPPHCPQMVAPQIGAIEEPLFPTSSRCRHAAGRDIPAGRRCPISDLGPIFGRRWCHGQPRCGGGTEGVGAGVRGASRVRAGVRVAPAGVQLSR